MAIQFSKEQIINRLKLDNPWWEAGEIEDDIKQFQRRGYFENFFKLVEEKQVRRAVVLMGPRRVGKTVMLYHTVDELIKKGVTPKSICYCSIDVPLYSGISLEEIFNLYREITGNEKNKEVYIIYDEIQYLKDWEVHLKSLVDAYRQTKFIVSGSAAAALRMKSNESGAGRFTDYMLPPLTFYEFLTLKNLKITTLIGTKIQELNNLFFDFINYGGYPEILNSDIIKKDTARYIQNDIIDKVLLRDLPSLYGIDNQVELNRFFTLVAYNTGNEFSIDGLSKDTGIAKNTIYKYLEYLEAAFLIRRIYRVGFEAKPYTRNTFFKIYLTNPSLRSSLFGEVKQDDEGIGSLVETAVASQLFPETNTNMYYARWDKGEVDFISLDKKGDVEVALEIKWSDKYYDNPGMLKSLLAFCKKNNVKNVFVTTITKGRYASQKSTKTIDGITINFVPTSEYSLALSFIHDLFINKNLLEIFEGIKSFKTPTAP